MSVFLTHGVYAARKSSLVEIRPIVHVGLNVLLVSEDGEAKFEPISRGRPGWLGFLV